MRQPDHRAKPSMWSIVRLLTVGVLVILLAGCGTNSTATTTASSTRQTNSGKAAPKATTTSAIPGLDLNAVNVHAQSGDLLVQSDHGFQCPYASLTPQDLETGHLVLASDRTTYSQADIAQMSSYLASYVANGGVYLKNVLPPTPPTLRWVLGGEASPIPGLPPSGNCATQLMLTNTGNAPIQVPQVGVKLTASPQQNTYQYRRIDVCSPDFKVQYCPITGEGGGSGCSIYDASIQLGTGAPDTVFSAIPTSAGGCSTLTIPPTSQIELNITFTLATNVPNNLIYSIIPVFTLDTTQGEQTLAFSQLASTLAFAAASQFSCYQLHGTTFVLLKSPAFVPVWCI